MGMIYGYCRISTNKQSIQRQIDNIKDYNENAIIFEEAFTGTKVEGRKEFQKLVGKWVATDKTDKDGNVVYELKGGKVKEGDTIIFDSVSRMSRNADEGIELYMDLFDKGIELIFIKEPHINTETYRKQIESTNIPNTDNKVVNLILEGVIKALKELAKEQIKLAFIQSEKEVKDLRQRTKEGIKAKREQAIKNNEEFQIGRKEGVKVVSKKSIQAKEQIIKYSKDFKGTLKDTEVMKLIGVARNSYYKYKKELVEELNQD